MTQVFSVTTALQAFYYNGDARKFEQELRTAGFTQIQVTAIVDAPSPRIRVTDRRFDDPRRPDGPVYLDMFSGLWLVVPRKEYAMAFNDATFQVNFVAPSRGRVSAS